MISFIAPAYLYHPVLLGSLIAQTDPEWECILLHDTYSGYYKNYIELLNDERIRLYFSKERQGKWGHTLRRIGLTEVSSRARFVCHTNADNYYTPNFVSDMKKNIGTSLGIYCDMIHSHFDWKIIYSKPAYGEIDCGNLVVRKEIAQDIGWQSDEFESDWHYIQGILNKYGIESFIKLNKVAYIHN